MNNVYENTNLKIYKKRNSKGVSLKFMSNFMNEKNETVVTDRDKLHTNWEKLVCCYA